MGRKCTAEFKVRELTKKTRQLIGASKIRAWHKSPSDALAKIWIGISLDEIQRIKPSQEPWKESIWPLIERRMSRHDCLNWMRANGFPEPPRSACIWCPFHSDEEWIRQKNEEPDEWRKSVEFDRELRLAAGSCTGTAKLRGEVFLHASLVPLDQVQFGKVKSHAQLDLFQNECAGMCGV